MRNITTLSNKVPIQTKRLLNNQYLYILMMEKGKMLSLLFKNSRPNPRKSSCKTETKERKL